MTYFYRADLSNYRQAKYPFFIKIKSTGELHDYYERTKGIYQYDQGYYSEASMAESVFCSSSEYDDDFFKSNFLLFIVLEEGSGSVRHKVAHELSVDGSLSVDITRIIPGIGTADMAQWHIMLVLDRALSEKDIIISLTEEQLPVY